MDKKTEEELNKIIKNALYVRHQLALGTRSLTPLNLGEEKEKFFNSKHYSPQFIYRKHKVRVPLSYVEKLHSDLKQLDLPKDLKIYLENVFEELKILIKLKKSVGSENFSMLSADLLKITGREISGAISNIPKTGIAKSDRGRMHPAAEIQKKFQNHIKSKYKIKNFEVLIDHFNHYIIWQEDNRIAVGNNVKRSAKNVQRLLVHEVDTHFLKSHNQRHVLKNPLLMFTLYGESLLGSEGLAVYNEVTTETITKSAFKNYKLRLTAAHNISLSFREIFNILSQKLTPKQAFITTYRVKRGLSDTSKPGGHAKDASYLLGYIKVKNYIENGGSPSLLYTTGSTTLLKILSKHNLVSTKGLVLPKFLI